MDTNEQRATLRSRASNGIARIGPGRLQFRSRQCTINTIVVQRQYISSSLMLVKADAGQRTLDRYPSESTRRFFTRQRIRTCPCACLSHGRRDAAAPIPRYHFQSGSQLYSFVQLHRFTSTGESARHAADEFGIMDRPGLIIRHRTRRLFPSFRQLHTCPQVFKNKFRSIEMVSGCV